MKNLISVMLMIGFVMTGFAQSVENKNPDKAVNEKRLYICPMHQEIMMDTPGKCSKCEMELTETVDVKKGYCPHCKSEFYIKEGKCLKCSKKVAKYSKKDVQKK